MRYEHKLDIKAPREHVIKLFEDPQNLKEWQPELLSIETLCGTPGELGAKSKHLTMQGKQIQEITETITVKRPPDHYSATYETGSVWNLVENRFYQIEPTKTRWKVISEFNSSNILTKIVTVFMLAAYKKQTREAMDRFKEFAESHSRDR